MNGLQIFRHPIFGEIRTLQESGKTLLCGADTAKALGYARPNDAVTAHCRSTVKRRIGVQTGVKADGSPALQNVEMLFITEGDLCRLAAQSKLPGAAAFESWIFDDVIPTVLKTGGYIAASAEMSDQEIMARALMVAQKTIAHKDELISTQAAKIEADRPKVLFADAVDVSDTSILIGELAKLIKQNGVDIGEKRLFTWMRNNGYLIQRKGVDYNGPTQKSMDLGLFKVRERTITNPDGSVRITKTTKVTGKGQRYFIEKFLAKEKNPSATLDGNREIL